MKYSYLSQLIFFILKSTVFDINVNTLALLGFGFLYVESFYICYVKVQFL